jgi:hypothetical protein
MNVGDVISGFETEDGITLHVISAIDVENDEMSIDISIYEPTDENFAWAIQQLASLQET